jgi:enamine deaminase RidA (YjgF/YER057c/UK114 family)
MSTQSGTSNVERQLMAIGLDLPPSKQPVANYLGCKQSGDLLYVSGQIGVVRGAVGSDVTLAEGQLCARQAVLQMLRTVKDQIGDLDRIVSVDKLLGFVRSAADFTQQPKVIDGASDLLIALFGEAGRHSRTATGAPQLPFGASVQLEMTLRVRSE